MTDKKPKQNKPHLLDDLVDIRDIEYDYDLDIQKRIYVFKQQIKNPYRYRCGDVIVNVSYKNECLLEDCLKEYLLREINHG